MFDVSAARGALAADLFSSSSRSATAATPRVLGRLHGRGVTFDGKGRKKSITHSGRSHSHRGHSKSVDLQQAAPSPLPSPPLAPPPPHHTLTHAALARGAPSLHMPPLPADCVLRLARVAPSQPSDDRTLPMAAPTPMLLQPRWEGPSPRLSSPILAAPSIVCVTCG